jgi:hypothetical protein
MKYLKLTNCPIAILKDAKYQGDLEKDRINWPVLGFNVGQLKINSFQYSSGDDFIQYLPITDEAKLNNFLAEIQADLVALGGSRSAEIVDEDTEVVKATAQAARGPQLTEQETRNKARNELIEQAVVTYQGVNITASTYDIALMDRFVETLNRRNKKVQWKGFDPDTGDIVRIELDSADFEKIKDAVFDQGQLIHIESDTQIPVNPWPIEVI